MARIAYPHHAADVPVHFPKIGRQSVLMLSRTVTPPIHHADHIVAAADNVLEAARVTLGGVQLLQARHVRASDTHLRRMSSRIRTPTKWKRAALVQQRRWVSILNVSRHFVRAHLSLTPKPSLTESKRK
jgi:hypothetical protein